MNSLLAQISMILIFKINNQLMIAAQNQQKLANIRHYSYFYRTDHTEIKFNSKPETSHAYILTGIARNSCTGIDIYQHYFLSAYSKDYKKRQESCRIQRRHISVFFLHFAKIYLIKTFLSSNQNLSIAINEAIFNLLGNLSEKDSLLYTYMRIFINEFYERQFRLLLRDRSGKYIDMALRISKQIDTINQNFIKYVQTKIEHIQSSEYVPYGFKQKELIKYIKDSFSCVIHLQIPPKNKKKQVFKQFYNNNWKFINLKIPFLNEDNSQKYYQNAIILPKYTLEEQPILMKCLSYFKLQYSMKQQISYQFKIQFSKGILKECIKYNRSTNFFYPDLQITDIYIDHKTLRPILSYNNFIREAAGLKGRFKNIQMQISTQATPSQLDFTTCHLEMIERNIWLMQRKYYFPQYQINEKQKDQEEDEGYQIKVQDFDEEELSEQKLLQKVHVWKIINIIYEILNHKFLSKSLYNQYYEKLFIKNEKLSIIPFYFDKYRIILEQIFKDIQNGILKLSNLFGQQPIKVQMLSKKYQQKDLPLIDNQSPSFRYQLRQLQSHFQIQFDEDSVMKKLRMQGIKSYLYERYQIIKQITNLILHKTAFKKLPNVVKYIICYIININEELELKQLMRSKTISLSIKEDQILEELEGQYNGINLMQEFLKRNKNLRIVEQKIREYKSRQDVNSIFIKSNTDIMNNFQIIGKTYKEIVHIESLKHSTLPKQELKIQIRNVIDVEIDNESKIQMINIINDHLHQRIYMLRCQLGKILQTFIDRIFKKFILIPGHFHRRSDLKCQKQGVYYNHQLIFLLNLLLTIDSKNWQRIKNYYRPIFTTMGVQIKTPLRRIDQCSKEEVIMKIEKIERLNKIIQSHKNTDENNQESNQMMQQLEYSTNGSNSSMQM